MPNAQDQKRAKISTLNPACDPAFCILMLGITLPICSGPKDVAALDWTFLQIARFAQELKVGRIIRTRLREWTNVIKV
jgi:hypothetical protein